MGDIKPQRVVRKRTKGFKLQDASPNGLPVVYVGRPTKWGNPWRLYSKREFEKHKDDLDPNNMFVTSEQKLLGLYENKIRYQLVVYQHFLDPLFGKNLACWCPLDQPCHVDVLLKIIEEIQKGRV